MLNKMITCTYQEHNKAQNILLNTSNDLFTSILSDFMSFEQSTGHIICLGFQVPPHPLPSPPAPRPVFNQIKTNLLSSYQKGEQSWEIAELPLLQNQYTYYRRREEGRGNKSDCGSPSVHIYRLYNISYVYVWWCGREQLSPEIHSSVPWIDMNFYCSSLHLFGYPRSSLCNLESFDSLI